MMKIIGHQQITEYLSRVAKTNNPSHAYLFSGPEHVGKATVAKWFAKTLLCEEEASCGTCRACVEIEKEIYPDFYHVRSDNEKRGITIDEIRKIRLALSHTSFRNGYKIAIIDPVNEVFKEAANAFLKLMEEPPGKTVFILIAHGLENVIPTIISRAERITFSLVPRDEIASALPISYSPEQKEFIARISLGRIGQALTASPETIRKQAEDEREILELLMAPAHTQLLLLQKLIKRQKARPARPLARLTEYVGNILHDALLHKIGLGERVVHKYIGRELKEFNSHLKLSQIFLALDRLLAIDSDMRHNVNEELIWSEFFLKLSRTAPS